MQDFRAKLCELLEDASKEPDEIMVLTGVAASALATVQARVGKKAALMLVEILREGVETEWVSGDLGS